jgi:PAS domain-containing protein
VAAPVVRPKTRGFTWPGRLIIRSLLLGVAVWVIASVPQLSLMQRIINANDSSRAKAVAMWLSADAARAFESGLDISNAADAVLAYPGVEAAVILDSRTGAVLAPGRRGTETIKTIRDLKLAPADVLTTRGLVIGERVEVATPVVTRDGRRPAVAWVTFRQRPPAEAQNIGPIMAMSLLFALAVSLLTAALIRRTTLAAMTRLRDDVELAIAGRLDAVDDPLGAKPMREAVDVINYLGTRYRAAPQRSAAPDRAGASTPASATSGAAASMAQQAASVVESGGPSVGHGVGSGSSAPRSAGSPVAAVNAGPPASGASAPASSSAASGASASRGGPPVDPNEACWVTDEAFIVSQATPACARVLGIQPSAVQGKHLVDATADQALVDGILQCLGALPPAGESRARVAAGSGRPKAIEIIMSRSGDDMPVSVRFVPDAS